MGYKIYAPKPIADECMKLLEDKGFEELATELGITYKGAAAVYYRALQKIKKKIGEDRDGFHGTAEAGKDRK